MMIYNVLSNTLQIIICASSTRFHTSNKRYPLANISFKSPHQITMFILTLETEASKDPIKHEVRPFMQVTVHR